MVEPSDPKEVRVTFDGYSLAWIIAGGLTYNYCQRGEFGAHISALATARRNSLIDTHRAHDVLPTRDMMAKQP
jgi:hypothetical protein